MRYSKGAVALAIASSFAILILATWIIGSWKTVVIAGSSFIALLGTLVGLWPFVQNRIYRIVHQESKKALSQLQAYQAISAYLGQERPLPVLTSWTLAADNMVEVVRAIHDRKPTVLVELGSGSSTVIIATQLARMGRGAHLFSLEHDLEYAKLTRRALEMAGLSQFSTVIDAPLEEIELADRRTVTWYAQNAVDNVPEGIELLLVDGPPRRTGPMARYPAVPVLKERLAPSCIVFVDDANRKDESAAIKKWTQEVAGFESVVIGTSDGLGRLERSFSNQK